MQTPPLRALYDAYSFAVIPRIGGLVANDADSYQYLVESIRRFPDQVRSAWGCQGGGGASGWIGCCVPAPRMLCVRVMRLSSLGLLRFFIRKERRPWLKSREVVERVGVCVWFDRDECVTCM